MNNRARKRLVCSQSKYYHERRHRKTAADYAWDNMRPVGREFGSPDYDRLMMIDNLSYGAIIEYCAESKLFVGRVEGIARAHSQAETRDEAIDNLRDVLEMLSTTPSFAKALASMPNVGVDSDFSRRDSLAADALAAADRMVESIDQTVQFVEESKKRIDQMENRDLKS